MKYALVDGIKTEAEKGVKGICPVCDAELIPKCGKVYAKHWAHRSIISCDRWWEPETEWHRNWKNNYRADWQEVTLFDKQTNEKHIADIRTVHKLVIEFQRSPIKSEERISREKFYKNMLWVVDGSRLKRDYSRFRKGKDSLFFTETINKGVYIVEYPDAVFPANWLESSVPVIFDFLGLSTDSTDEIKNTLWCLVPRREQAGKAYVVGIKREVFIKITSNYPTLFQQKPEPKRQKQQIAFRPGRIVRPGPLIDLIEKRMASGKWRPRRRW